MNKQEIIERKIDEEFEYEGIKLKCVGSTNCKDCYFDLRKTNHCYDKNCAADERSNKLEVKFIRIK